MAKTSRTVRKVLVTTQYHGVYFGTLLDHDPKERTCVLADARMAIQWGTTDGVDQLAATGPTSKSKIGAPAPKIWLCGITSLVDATAEASAAWTTQ